MSNSGSKALELRWTHVCSPYGDTPYFLCQTVVWSGLEALFGMVEPFWTHVKLPDTPCSERTTTPQEGTWNIKRIHDFGVVQSFRTWSNHCVKQWFDQVLQHYGPSTIHIGYQWQTLYQNSGWFVSATPTRTTEKSCLQGSFTQVQYTILQTVLVSF